MGRFKAVRSWLWNVGAAVFYVGVTVYALSFAVDLLDPQPGGDLKAYKTTDFLGMCEYTEVHILQSPDKTKVARMGYSDCGATTNWQSGLVIFNASTGKSFSGLFGLDGKPDALKMQWANDHTLVISDFPVEKMLWFKQDYFSGAKLVLKP